MNRLVLTILTWFITCLAGTVLEILIISSDNVTIQPGQYGISFLFIFMMALCSSLPAMIVYYILIPKIYSKNSPISSKIFLSIYALIATILSFIAFSSLWGIPVINFFKVDSGMILTLPYVIIFVLCIFIFKYKQLPLPAVSEDTEQPSLETKNTKDLVTATIILAVICLLLNFFQLYSTLASLQVSLDAASIKPRIITTYGIFFIILIAGIFMFGLRNKLGWILLTSYAANSIIGLAFFFVTMLRNTYRLSGAWTLMPYFVCCFIWGMLLVLLHKKPVVQRFNIKLSHRLIAYSIAAIYIAASFLVKSK